MWRVMWGVLNGSLLVNNVQNNCLYHDKNYNIYNYYTLHYTNY